MTLGEEQLKKYEKGQSRISSGMVVMLSRALGTSVTDLYSGVQEMDYRWSPEEIKHHVTNLLKGLSDELTTTANSAR